MRSFGLILRSLVFNLVFYLVLIGYFIAALPTLVMPPRAMVAVATHWGRTNLRLLRMICGLDVEWRGLEKIPRGSLLVAAKHQSAWETFALLWLFRDPTFIIKRELFALPVYGWYARKADMIAVDRTGGKQALTDMIARAREALGKGRQIVIFPEGTRRPAGAEPDYKIGIAHLYAACGVPCLPIALNSGLFWPRRSFLRYPGTVRVEILDPIPPGLPRKAFFARLQNEIETATAKLVEEGRRELGPGHEI
jgi:1-acyl-sn-glycerol-3-phosphate acyltransferase